MNSDPKQRFDVDPVLIKISPYIPDEEIDLLFPFRNYNIQGRVREYKASQLYRVHVLTMIKGIASFNRVCKDIKTTRALRDFCHFKNKESIPVKRVLSEFRSHLKPHGFEEISRLITLSFLNTVTLPVMKVAVPDATDMPANCNGFAKKNAIVR